MARISSPSVDDCPKRSRWQLSSGPIYWPVAKVISAGDFSGLICVDHMMSADTDIIK